MRELYGILEKMKARPAMWTGEYRLKSIKTFLDGYSFALYDNGLADLDSQLSSFHDWTSKKLGFRESTAGWHSIILAVAIGLNANDVEWDTYDSDVTLEQHKESIRLFYELYEEFIHG